MSNAIFLILSIAILTTACISPFTLDKEEIRDLEVYPIAQRLVSRCKKTFTELQNLQATMKQDSFASLINQYEAAHLGPTSNSS